MQIITSAKEDMFLLWFVCLFVCLQDNSKSYRLILTQLFGGVGLRTGNNWLDFGHNLDPDPGIFFKEFIIIVR